jgi:uncharacterized membrane protein (DUF2068 family)
MGLLTGPTENMTASVKAARWLFVILGLIWLVFGTWSIIRLSDSEGNLSPLMLAFIAGLMFVNAAVLIWISWGIGRGQKWYYYFGLITLAGNIFLTLTDDFGIFDLIVLIIAVALFVILVVTRLNYIHD